MNTPESSDVRRETANLFGEIAPLYNRFTQHLDAPDSPVNRWVREHLGRGRRAIDVGCGTGRQTVLLADHYDDVIGVDAAEEMIAIARRQRLRPNVDYQVRDLFTLAPESYGRFDLVFAFSCVLHAGPPELVLARLRDLVQPGGTLLILEPARPEGWGGAGWQVELAFETARAKFEATGNIEDAATALKLILSSSWQRISQISVPMTSEEFEREYAAALPGVVLSEGNDQQGFLGAVWHAAAE